MKDELFDFKTAFVNLIRRQGPGNAAGSGPRCFPPAPRGIGVCHLKYLFALEEMPGDGEGRRIESYRLRVVPPGAASPP